MSEDMPQYLGVCLEFLRKLHGWSQGSLARLLDVPVRQIQQYERGRVEIPEEHLVVICSYFHVDPGDFLCLWLMEAVMTDPIFLDQIRVLAYTIRERQKEV